MGRVKPEGPAAHASTSGRLEEINNRLEELSARGRELGELTKSVPAERSQARRSAELVEIASLRAEAAADAAMRACQRAAAAHDRAAALHDYLAATGVGDPERHRERARDHRSLAENDRSTAHRMQENNLVRRSKSLRRA